MTKYVVVNIPQPRVKSYWVEQNRFSNHIENAYVFDNRDEAVKKVGEIWNETEHELDCYVEKYKKVSSKAWGLRKDNGAIDWKILGIAISIFVTVGLFGLLLIPQLLKLFNEVATLDRWCESVKYCIEKWIPIASIELSAMGVMKVVAINNSNSETNSNQ